MRLKLKWETEPGMGYSRFYKAVVPVRVRRWGGTRQYAKAIPSRIKCMLYRAWHRIANAYADAEAKWRFGFCNAAPAVRSGGYRFWRCGNPKAVCAATRKHRTNNYVWRDGERVKFDPLPNDSTWRGQRKHRHCQGTFRQEREWNRYYATNR